MEIHIFDEQQDLKISAAVIKAAVVEVLSFEGVHCDEISVHLVDTPTISELHGRFFDDLSPTDCISLPMDSPDEEGYCVLGEVFLCPATAAAYAKKHAKDPYHEVTLYLVHAILHLLGYDDHGAAEPEMRAAETRHTDNLQKRGLCLKPGS